MTLQAEAKKKMSQPGAEAGPSWGRFTSQELNEFKAQVLPLTGLDLNAYKPKQLERRLNSLLDKNRCSRLSDLYEQMAASPASCQEFLHGVTISVSEFFRDAENFKRLEETILPALQASFGKLRIWSAGCATGAELLSVGMLLEERGWIDGCELIGTDVDPKILDTALKALYTPYEVQSLDAWRLKRYFIHEGKHFKFVGDRILARVAYQRHNLLSDKPLGDCHLIVCRNVAIYFNDESKSSLYRAFHEALVPGGILFLGSAERMLNASAFGFAAVQPYFYQKVPR